VVNKQSSLTIEENKEDIAPKENLPVDYEIECPRCHDLMNLRSDFDKFFYFCEECSFNLSFMQQ
jgi:hypothetical protein